MSKLLPVPSLIKKIEDYITIITIIAIFASLSLPIMIFADVAFNDKINISNDVNDDSFEHQITSAGSNAYVVWVKEDSSSPFALSLLMKASTDKGESFGSTVTLSAPTGGESRLLPKINATGSKLYVVWEEKQSSTVRQVFFTNTTNDGSTTFTKEDLSGSSVLSLAPEIAIAGSNVYVVWEERETGAPPDADAEIFFINSTDDGVTFDWGGISPLNLSSDTDTSNSPRIAASGNNVYVTWFNDSSTDTIGFINSTDGGANFNTAKSLGVPNDVSPNPQIAANGNNVYVVWENVTAGRADIAFTNSTDKGKNFLGGPINLSNTAGTSIKPQIAVSGSNVYVAWEDDTDGDFDILLRASTDGGISFGSIINMSSNTGTSNNVKIVASGNDIHAIWQDTTTGTGDIFFRSSPDSGSTLCSFVISANEVATFRPPEIAVSGSSVYTSWENRTDTVSDVTLRNGTAATSNCVVLFNATQYITTGATNITVNDPSSNDNSLVEETFPVQVTSSTDPSGITLTLDETDVDTGIFNGTFTFTETDSSSGSTLKVSPSDIITTNKTASGHIATSIIFPRVIVFEKGGSEFSEFNFDDRVTVKITDQNSNLTNAVETINISVSSPSDSITLDLVESGPKTGIFNKDTLIFYENDGLFPISGTVTISQSDPTPATTSSYNVPYSADEIDLTGVTVTSDTESPSFNFILNLTETGVDTRLFNSKLSFTTGTSVNSSTIKVSESDIISIEYEGSTVNALITPNTNSSVGALKAGIFNTITATYKDASKDVQITPGGGGGGGGGGLVRPSLVLDIVASIAALGGIGGGGGASPVLNLKALSQSTFLDMPDVIEEGLINFDPFTPLEAHDVTAEEFETFDFPFSIDNDGYALAGYSNTLDTKTLNTGEATKIKTVFYMPFELEHIAFYTNIGEGDSLDDSDTFLRFYKSKPDLFQIKDENGFFEYINITIEEVGIKKTVTFDIKFLNPMPKSDIVLRMWDKDLHSTTVLIFDAIEVVGSPQEPIQEPAPEDLEIPEPGTTVPETSELKMESKIIVPDWIRTNAKWWNEEQITDSDFAKGIEYLIKNEIIVAPPAISEEQEQTVETIPDWVKSSAGWWGNGLLTDQEFVNGIQWLIKNGIMKIQINS